MILEGVAWQRLAHELPSGFTNRKAQHRYVITTVCEAMFTLFQSGSVSGTRTSCFLQHPGHSPQAQSKDPTFSHLVETPRRPDSLQQASGAPALRPHENGGQCQHSGVSQALRMSPAALTMRHKTSDKSHRGATERTQQSFYLRPPSSMGNGGLPGGKQLTRVKTRKGLQLPRGGLCSVSV